MIDSGEKWMIADAASLPTTNDYYYLFTRQDGTVDSLPALQIPRE
jgi:beta-xylosidase